MTRTEKIAELEKHMTDQQLDDALAMVRHGAQAMSVFETLDPDQQASILRAKNNAQQGIGVQDAEVAFATRAHKFTAS